LVAPGSAAQVELRRPPALVLLALPAFLVGYRRLFGPTDLPLLAGSLLADALLAGGFDLRLLPAHLTGDRLRPTHLAFAGGDLLRRNRLLLPGAALFRLDRLHFAGFQLFLAHLHGAPLSGLGTLLGALAAAVRHGFRAGGAAL